MLPKIPDKSRGLFFALAIFLSCICRQAGAVEKFAELDPLRVEQIAPMLPERPAGFGKPVEDRKFWSSSQVGEISAKALQDAEKLLAKPFPVWDESLYLDFSKTGQRPPGEKMMSARNGWIFPLVLAECFENKGRFLPKIREVLLEYVKQPTWTLPAHDRDLGNFHRKHYSVDLASSAQAAQLAQAVYLLGGKLEPDVRAEVMGALETRIFKPIRESLRTGNGNWWMGSKSKPSQNNWNAVCLAGVVGAARTVLPDRHDRSIFVAAGDQYSAYFLNGCRSDG